MRSYSRGRGAKRARAPLGQKYRSRDGASARLTLSSALRVLEALTGACLTVLLTLDLTVVAGEEAGLLEGTATLRIFGGQRAGNAVTHGVRLRAVSAAGHGGFDVVLVDELEQLERLTRDHATGLALEVVVDAFAVDGDLTRTCADPNTSNGGLALTSGVRLSFGHYLSIPGKIWDQSGRTAGCCALWGCSAVPYTFSFASISRPSTFFGSMPFTASVTGRSG